MLSPSPQKACAFSSVFPSPPQELSVPPLFLNLSNALSFKRASLVAQLVKNLPAMQETPVQVLGWEDALEKG